MEISHGPQSLVPYFIMLSYFCVFLVGVDTVDI